MPNIPPTPRDPDQSEKSWYKTMQGWKTTLEIVAIPFAIVYAVVTVYQWRDLRHNFEVDQRAWVKPKVLWPKDMMDDKVTVMVNNLGQSVVDSTSMDAKIEILDRASQPSFAQSGIHTAAIFETLFPKDENSITVMRFSPEGKESPLTDKEIKALSQGDDYAVIWGYILYHDQFGVHWTRFCDWHAFTSKLIQFQAAGCTRYNSVGDGEYPPQ
jgi:hypothetical protein